MSYHTRAGSKSDDVDDEWVAVNEDPQQPQRAMMPDLHQDQQDQDQDQDPLQMSFSFITDGAPPSLSTSVASPGQDRDEGPLEGLPAADHLNGAAGDVLRDGDRQESQESVHDLQVAGDGGDYVEELEPAAAEEQEEEEEEVDLSEPQPERGARQLEVVEEDKSDDLVLVESAEGEPNQEQHPEEREPQTPPEEEEDPLAATEEPGEGRSPQGWEEMSAEFEDPRQLNDSLVEAEEQPTRQESLEPVPVSTAPSINASPDDLEPAPFSPSAPPSQLTSPPPSSNSNPPRKPGDEKNGPEGVQAALKVLWSCLLILLDVSGRSFLRFFSQGDRPQLVVPFIGAVFVLGYLSSCCCEKKEEPGKQIQIYFSAKEPLSNSALQPFWGDLLAELHQRGVSVAQPSPLKAPRAGADGALVFYFAEAKDTAEEQAIANSEEFKALSSQPGNLLLGFVQEQGEGKSGKKVAAVLTGKRSVVFTLRRTGGSYSPDLNRHTVKDLASTIMGLQRHHDAL